MVRSDGKHEVILADDPRLKDGWWAIERAADTSWRWTNGDAALPIGGDPSSAIIVEVLVGGALPYPVSCSESGQQPRPPLALCA